MHENYEVSNLTRTCTIIALILDGLSFFVLLFINLFINRFFNFIYSIEPQNELFMIQDLVRGILIFVFIFIAIFYIINLILFTKLINKKLTVKGAKAVTMYQIIYGVLSLGGNTISGVLYIVAGLNSNNNLDLPESHYKEY